MSENVSALNGPILLAKLDTDLIPTQQPTDIVSAVESRVGVCVWPEGWSECHALSEIEALRSEVLASCEDEKSSEQFGDESL